MICCSRKKIAICLNIPSRKTFFSKPQLAFLVWKSNTEYIRFPLTSQNILLQQAESVVSFAVCKITTRNFYYMLNKYCKIWILLIGHNAFKHQL